MSTDAEFDKYNSLKKNEIVGIIVLHFYRVETLVNEYLLHFFKPQQHVPEFRDILMNSEYLPWGTKVKFITKIPEIKQLEKDLHKIGKIRNKFAHQPILNDLVVTGSESGVYYKANEPRNRAASITIEESADYLPTVSSKELKLEQNAPEEDYVLFFKSYQRIVNVLKEETNKLMA